MSFANEFAYKSGLPPAFGARVGYLEDGSEYLGLQHPAALARFVAFVKYRVQLTGGDVFLRGQTEHHRGMTPALFRQVAAPELARRVDAYARVLGKIQESLPYGRFHRSNPGALFQHYGLKTPWLDLVDNLYTAVWFATHEHRSDSEFRSYYQPSRQRTGWVTLISTRSTENQHLHCIDLRKHHSSMNVRLHAQHGISAATQEDFASPALYDYGEFVVGRVCIPNNGAFALRGRLASPRFLFPPPSIDESFQLLLSSPTNALLATCERQFGLPNGALGRINAILYRAPRR